MPDLLIKGGTIVTASDTAKASILVKKGKIIRVSNQKVGQADEEIDASGLYIFPGLVDTHVHFRDPGMTQKENFLSGTKSALKGGVTTVFDMPTTQPVITSAEKFNEKLKIVQPKALVDFALYAGAGVDNLSELSALAEAGAIAFKTYMVAPPSERTHEYAGSFVTDAASLYRVMEGVKKTGRTLCVHAENDNTIRLLSDRLRLEGRHDASAHADSRPQFTETLAVSEALIIAQALNVKLHLLHISTRESVALIRMWKKMGSNVTAETCPHYLLLTRDALRKYGPDAKFNPPPRDQADNGALWHGISDGTIDMIVSDHAPHLKAEKSQGREDIWRAPPGTPGVESRLPLLLTAAAEKRISLQDVVRLCSTNPAKVFGLYPAKGEIAEGSDADFALVDLGKEWTLRSENLESKAKETFLFDGWKIRGQCVATYLRGELMMKDGNVTGEPGTGRLIKP